MNKTYTVILDSASGWWTLGPNPYPNEPEPYEELQEIMLGGIDMLENEEEEEDEWWEDEDSL